MNKPIPKTLKAEEAIALLEQLAQESPIYTTAIQSSIIPALRQRPPGEEISYRFFKDREASDFQSLSKLLGVKIDWLQVVIDANENVRKSYTQQKKSPPPLYDQIKDWI